MSFRKRISESRERSAQARAKRREERRRADRAKAATTAADRSKARAEKAKAKEAKAPPPKAKATPAKATPAKAKAKTTRDPKPQRRGKPAEGPAGAKDKVTAAKSTRGEPPVARPKRARWRPRTGRTAPAGGRRSLSTDASKVSNWLRSGVGEVLKLGREMVAIPVQLWLAGAEIAGAVVLRAWLRAVRPTLLALWRAGRAVLRWAQRHVTPARGVVAVSLVAIGALVASQWLDYHSVSVGSDAYAGAVGDVAPPPEIESEIAGNAHAWVMLPLALVALVALVLALTGRRRAAALLVPVGIAVILISVVVDAPKGLDEGDAAIAYEGASASLLEGFWMQIVTGVVLIACGLMLPRYLRPAPAGASVPSGPTLFQSAAARARKLAKRGPRPKRPARRARPKRKVQGAGT